MAVSSASCAQLGESVPSELSSRPFVQWATIAELEHNLGNKSRALPVRFGMNQVESQQRAAKYAVRVIFVEHLVLPSHPESVTRGTSVCPVLQSRAQPIVLKKVVCASLASFAWQGR